MINTNVSPKALNSNIINFLNKSLNTTQHQIMPLAGDASDRRYFRVIEDNKSYVLMVWKPFKDVKDYPFLSILNHFIANGINAPRAIDMSPEHGLVLLEDLGDLTLERKFWENQNQDLSLPFYKQALDELLKIHYTATANYNPQVSCFNISFDTKKFLWELNFGKTHLLEKLCGLRLSPLEERALNDDFTIICEALDKEPKRISHRDYHSRNLMLKLGKMRVIDFQDARLGPIQYDLVSLLCDSYVEINDSASQKLISYYLERSQVDFNNYISLDEFMSIYNLQVLQRCFKACGSFASFYNLRGDKRYLSYLKPTLGRITKHLKDQPQFKGFYSVLSNRGLLEMDFESL